MFDPLNASSNVSHGRLETETLTSEKYETFVKRSMSSVRAVSSHLNKYILYSVITYNLLLPIRKNIF